MRQLKLFRWAAVLTLAILLCTSAAARAFAAASLTPLGDLPGGSFGSIAYGVSADGSVVVGWSSEPFRWTADGGMVGLGYLPGYLYGYAFGVSADGSTVVGQSDSASSTQTFRWTAAGGMQGLGYLPGGGPYSAAYGVSGDGSVIVGYSDSLAGLSQAFRWTAAGGMQGLGDLPGGDFSSYASGVSADGSVIVGVGSPAFGAEAFRWTSDGGMMGLGILPGDAVSIALGVSGDGSTVVGVSGSGSVTEAFRWTSAGGMVGLGDLPGGELFSSAWGVSGDGSVVVGNGFSASGQEGFRWTSDGGMRTLWDVLLSHGVNPAADGWTQLHSAQGISADGNTIVGAGVRNGNGEAFVAVIPVVPEPAGDFNHDGTVDAADYVVWRKGLGTTYTQDDYGVWRAHFGTSLGVGSGSALPSAEPLSAAVPEPATPALGGMILLGLAIFARGVRRV